MQERRVSSGDQYIYGAEAQGDRDHSDEWGSPTGGGGGYSRKRSMASALADRSLGVAGSSPSAGGGMVRHTGAAQHGTPHARNRSGSHSHELRRRSSISAAADSAAAAAGSVRHVPSTSVRLYWLYGCSAAESANAKASVIARTMELVVGRLKSLLVDYIASILGSGTHALSLLVQRICTNIQVLISCCLRRCLICHLPTLQALYGPETLQHFGLAPREAADYLRAGVVLHR
jgi:hypothetical protein